MSIAIRELGLADELMVGELLDLFSPGWHDGLAPGASGTRAFSADNHTFLYGAYDDNEPVGWLWGVRVRRPTGAVMTYIHEVDVVAAARRRGIATLLLESAIGEARRSENHRVWLITDQTNEPAQALYRSLGAVDDDRGWLRFRWEL